MGAEGRVYVADTNGGKFIVFDAEGNELVTWETGKTMFGGPNLPYAVAVDGAGAVYVSGVGTDHHDESNPQTFIIEPAGYPSAHNRPGPGPGSVVAE